MPSRMANPAFVLPDGMKGIGTLFKAVDAGGITAELQEMVALRASQINGCALCAQMHGADLRKAGETDDRLVTVATWRDAPYFTDAERAALAGRLPDVERPPGAAPDHRQQLARGRDGPRQHDSTPRASPAPPGRASISAKTGGSTTSHAMRA